MEDEMNEREYPATDPVHTMSVDVEDYFQVEAFAGTVSPKDWDRFPSRVFDNTLRVLDLFDAHNVKATFFFVGWVADKFPSLVRETQRRGHEIACHSYWHRAIYKLTPGSSAKIQRQARVAIEQAANAGDRLSRSHVVHHGQNVCGALDILAEEGFVYDSSIYPIRHDLYGVPNAQRFPYTRLAANGASLHEFPPATVSLLGMTLPAAGGGYLRIFPRAYTDFAFRQIGRSAKQPVSVYFHPWEIDPAQPRIFGGFEIPLSALHQPAPHGEAGSSTS